ncbi:MAG: cupin domain-containing protein [Candidatus Lambdaproteobacteria bacterium]|nr:cupin domain-containing protein [Candidatus Lambdaproteobacteria bacterium]
MTEQTYRRAGHTNWLGRAADLQVQERTLDSGDVIPWHTHTTITDTFFCLEGTVSIELLGPTGRALLTPGQSHVVPPNQPHEVTPHGPARCRFILVQGMGKYDRQPVDPKTWRAAPSAG